MDKLQSNLANLLALVGPETWYNVWMAAGALWFIGCVYWGYGHIRRSAGHLNFRGTWYDAEQAEVLIKMIDEDCIKGNRVMKHDEMALLRKWRFGDTKTIGVKGNGYV